MNNIQLPNVSGSFYPASQTQLSKEIDNYLKHSPCSVDQAPTAIIVPHAGYIYSGAIAASAYHCILRFQQHYDQVILLSPSHTLGFYGVALSSAELFRTPLGDIPVNQNAIQQLSKLDGINFIDQAFSQEHALEVHLPFLQKTLHRFQLIPAIVGQAKPNLISTLIDSVITEKTLIVVSSDLSHFEPYETAVRHDKNTASAIKQLDYTSIQGQDACGCHPLNGLLKWAKKQQLQPELLDMRNSADTAGSPERVVGYGAWGLYHGE